MGLQLEILSWEVHFIIMNTKVFILSCLLSSSALGAPAAEAEADPQFLAGPLAAPYHAVAAANCVTEEEILITQVCTPSAENICTKETVETEEIEYEKVCKEVIDNICDAPLAHAVYKREAEAEADAQYLAGLPYAAAPFAHAVAPVALPAAHAVAHSVTATVKHACRAVTTVACSDVENKIPKTTREPVETTHVAHAAYGL